VDEDDKLKVSYKLARKPHRTTCFYRVSLLRNSSTCPEKDEIGHWCERRKNFGKVCRSKM